MSFWNTIENVNIYFVNVIQQNSNDFCLAFVATCLVIFGDNINAFVRRNVKNYFFLFRIIIFIFLCAMGYGLMTVTIHPIIHSLFLKVPRDYSFIVIVFCFIFLGVIAERKRFL